MVADGAAQPAKVSGGALDRFGRELLEFVDYRVVGLLILLVVGVFLLVKRRKSGHFPSIYECLKVGEACGLIFTGLIAACVFLLTRPPAVEQLSHETCLVVGLITLVLTAYFGCKTIIDAYKSEL